MSMKESKINSFIINSNRVYGLGDLFGDIGGFKETVLMIGAFFVGFFQDKMYISALLKSVY